MAEARLGCQAKVKAAKIFNKYCVGQKNRIYGGLRMLPPNSITRDHYCPFRNENTLKIS
jgi:hypothetical protein